MMSQPPFPTNRRCSPPAGIFAWKVWAAAFVVLTLSSCYLRAEKPLEETEYLSIAKPEWIAQAPDPSGYYLPITESEDEDTPVLLQRVESGRFLYSIDVDGDKTFEVTIFPLAEPGTLLIQIVDPSKEREHVAEFIPARFQNDTLTLYQQTSLHFSSNRSYRRFPSLPTIETEFLWDKEAWQTVAESHHVVLDSSLEQVTSETAMANLIPAINDMFARNAFGQGEAFRRVDAKLHQLAN